MKLTDYAKLRAGLQANVEPAAPGTVTAVAEGLRAGLAASGLFHTVEVDVTDDDDRLVIAMVGFEPGVDSVHVTTVLEQLWSHRVGQQSWWAHGTLVERDHVELQAAVVPTASEGFVTAHLVAQASPAPVPATVGVQRPAPEPAGQRSGGRRTRGWGIVRPVLQPA